MTTMRVLVAGLLGGLAMFIWSAIAHMVLPLGEVGVSEIPNEAAVVGAMKANMAEKPGFYIFPGTGVGKSARKQEQQEAMNRMAENYANNPSGILIYHPPGRAFAFGRWLGTEFAAEVIESLLAVFLLAQTRIVTFGGSVGFIVVVGVAAAFATNISYWNWYGFPTDYTVAYMFTQVVSFLCAGIVAALVLKNAPPRMAS